MSDSQIRSDSETGPEEGEATSSDIATDSRREFLIKTGKYALYASPVILTMLAPRVGIYAQSGGGGDCFDGGLMPVACTSVTIS